ncbi:MAG: group II intron maturase-specific domain-containing protein, partial [Phaeodactylibacter sp.]|uniref:group II intron maturase-specific domain-containing protein n=1 Tax=Phaeodactylibacter sp. TaxID=1940289 RepID=UPI0032EADF4C
VAKALNPIIAGWVNHFGMFNPRQLMRAMGSLNDRLAKWACRRYKRFGKSMRKASRFLRNLAVEKPLLSYHWRKGYHTA